MWCKEIQVNRLARLEVGSIGLDEMTADGGGWGGVRAGCSELRVGRSVLRRLRYVRDGFQTFSDVFRRFDTF